MGFLRRFPISGIFVLRDVEHVFSMEGSRETKVDGFLKKRSILGHFLEFLEFRGANLIMKTKPCMRWIEEFEFGLVDRIECPWYSGGK